MTSVLSTGTVLAPKNGQYCSNAVVFQHLPKECSYLILTDFGNLITVSYVDLEIRYEISRNYKEAKAIQHPLPTVRERIQEQIDLLMQALNRCPEHADSAL